VIIFDFRGHGKSGGKFTWGSRETMDMAAIMNYASSGGYSHIGILAFSLGAAAAINSASGRNDIDSMILVSCPSSFEAIDYHFWEPEMLSDLKDNMECKWEGKGVRSGNPFLAKDKPVNSVKSLKNIPILFIHGDNDWVVKERHSKKLYEAANTYKRIEIVKGGLHAERLIQLHTEMMARLISEWFSETMGKERKLQ
jgi:alpha/beta superfamily hydrolase